MLKTVTTIIITQMPTLDDPARKRVLTFDFVSRWDWSETWENLTQKGTIVLPKKVYARDKNNKLFQLFGTAKNVGGFSASPMFLRGDRVTLDRGYTYWDKDLNEQAAKTKRIITGYISNVKSKQPIELDVEDNMWKLKQLPAPNKSWPSTTSLEDILTEMLKPYNDLAAAADKFTVNVRTETKIKFDTTNLMSQNESVAQFLARLRRDYHFDSYFIGNELRCGSLVYLDSDATTPPPVFEFQENIIDAESSLDYRRKDDVVLSAVCSNYLEDRTGTFNEDGTEKTKRRRIEVLVTLKVTKKLINGEVVFTDDPVIKEVVKGAKPEPNVEGERFTLFAPWAGTVDELANYAIAELKKFYYEGFRGSFKTFGLPHVKQGDNIQFINKILPEQNGYYKVKGVQYSGGINGERQEIKLHYKVSL